MGGRRLRRRRHPAQDRRVPPAVSVIMPVHDRERYVREAIEQVLAQTFDRARELGVDVRYFTRIYGSRMKRLLLRRA